ncbi:MAG: hypothetical protein ABJA50_12940, partial [Chloroflexota bacterium]
SMPDEPADLTIMDGRCIERLAELPAFEPGAQVLWIDPTSGQQPAINTPLRLPQLLPFLDAESALYNDMSPEAAPIRVLLADPYQLFRQALKRCLNEQPDFQIVLEVSSPEEYKAVRNRSDYDVAIVASDLIAGTRSTAPLSPTDRHLSGTDFENSGDRQPVVILVADEDIDGLISMRIEERARTNKRNRPVYLHRSVSVETLTETLRRLCDNVRSDMEGGF